MEGVSVHKNFLTHDECNEFLNFAKNNFEVDSRTYSIGWYAKTNRSLKFEEIISEKINIITPITPFYISWINLTEYENGRDLDLHYDERSNYTFTIPLTDNYIGGDFIVEDSKFTLQKGDCISFDGSRYLHGVESVTSGYRASINVWIKKGNKPKL